MGEGSSSQAPKGPGPSAGPGKLWAAVLPNPKLKLMDQPRKLSGPGAGSDAPETLRDPDRAKLFGVDSALHPHSWDALASGVDAGQAKGRADAESLGGTR